MTNATLHQIIQTLGHANPIQRTRARESLLELGSSAIDALIDAMQYHPDKRIQQEAAGVLSLMHDPRIGQAMTAMITHPNVILAQLAVEALEKYADCSLLAGVLQRLPDCRPVIQLHLITVLARLRDPQIVPALMSVLETAAFPALRYTTIQALGQLGDPQAIPLIATFANDEDHHVRKRVQIAITLLSEKSEQS